MNACTEYALVQQTTADYLEQQLGWQSIYACNNRTSEQIAFRAAVRQGDCMSDIIIFEAEAHQVEVRKAAVSKQLKNIYTSGELEQEATVSKMETV